MIDLGALTALPVTIYDSRITSNMVVIKAVLSTPGAMNGDWTVSTADGLLTVTGDMSYASNVALYLMKRSYY